MVLSDFFLWNPIPASAVQLNPARSSVTGWFWAYRGLLPIGNSEEKGPFQPVQVIGGRPKSGMAGGETRMVALCSGPCGEPIGIETFEFHSLSC
jgi:hypothetical protein